ncbi:MAG: Rieske 2Fe-2S domain-containing protein [Chitinophagaceae bacterium]
MAQNYKWHKIAEDETDIAFQSNQIAVVEVNGKIIGLVRHEDRWFAFAHKCPHASGILTDGWIDPKGDVVCPVHRYRFSLDNGRNTSGEGFYLKRWPVEIRADGIYVRMEEGGLFSWI